MITKATVTTIGPWQSGWTADMVTKCYATYVFDITDLAAGFSYINLGPGHSSLGFSPSVSAPTIVQPEYQVEYQQPLVNPASPFSGNPGAYYTVTGAVPFAGQAPQYTQQSYASQTRWSSTDPADYTWVADFRALNSQRWCFFWRIFRRSRRGTSIRGPRCRARKHVWKFTYQSGALNYKLSPVTAYAGRYLLQEVSSAAAGNVITDNTPWQFCVAYFGGECRTGSNPGDVYMSVPQAGGNLSSSLGICSTNYLDENMPCAIAMQKSGASILQQEIDVPDSVGTNWRKVSTGFMGPGREYDFCDWRLWSPRGSGRSSPATGVAAYAPICSSPSFRRSPARRRRPAEAALSNQSR